MAKQIIRTTTRKIRNSKTTTDRQGKKHCGYCGAYIGNKGKKRV